MVSKQPPVAEKRPHTTTIHGHTLEDPYFWMRNIEDPAVMAYIDAEQAYTKTVMESETALQESLFQELKARIQEVDQTVPYRQGHFLYYSRTIEGGEYSIHCRKALSDEAEEEILIDGNAEAKGRDYFSIGAIAPSPTGRFLAYSIDESGEEYYTLFIKDLVTGELLSESIAMTSGEIEWSNDESHLFYVRCDEFHHPLFAYRHTLGSDTSEDSLIYEEKDTAFTVGLSKTTSHSFLLIELDGANQSEVWFLPADEPTKAPKQFLPRTPEEEVSLDHHKGYFYFLTNADGAIDFKLMRCPDTLQGKEHWETLLSHEAGNLLVDFGLFGDFLVVQRRQNVLDSIFVYPYTSLLTGQKPTTLSFEGEPYSLSLSSAEEEPTSNILRVTYESMKRPYEIFDIDLSTQKRELRKKQSIPGGFDEHSYVSERIFVTARDGVRVPVTLLYKKDTKRDGSAPLLLYGYGSYGISCLPHFSSRRFCLVDRGWIWAIAHIRGGQELGYQWYLDGKLSKKTNTFHDFIDCAKGLIERNYTSKGRIAIEGRSAGGLLMGAVLNLAPSLFGAAVAGVPFVDVVNTMLDETLPLTTGEYNEWGNPTKDPDAFEYILSYSPYDNVKEQDYPHILITAGLNDYRVTYWEPLKWLAKLREVQREEQLLLLHMNREAGHFGKSGRFDYLREPALTLAFLLRAIHRQ